MSLPERKEAFDVPPIKFHWQSGTATIEWTVWPDRKTGVGSGLIRYLNYKHSHDNLPYRGVTTIAVKNWIFEFKGACFWRKGDCPFRVEHEDIKDHLTNPDPTKGWGMEGFALRQKPDGRIVVKRYRWRNKGAVIVGGNSAQTETVEKMKMSEQNVQVPADKLLVTIYLGAENADGTLFNDDRKRVVLDRQAYVNLQKMVNEGVNVPLMQIGQDLAAKAAA